MLKLTAKELTLSLEAFGLLSTEKVKKNPKLAYNLGKTSKCIRTEAEAIKTQEVEIYKSFGATAVEGGGFRLDLASMDADKRAEFDAQIKELHAVEVEIWGHKLTLAEIEKAEIELSPLQYDLLSWMIADPDSEDARPADQVAAAAG